MEGKSSAGSNLMPGGSYSFLDLQGSMQANHQQNPRPYQSFMAYSQQLRDVFPSRVRNMQQSEQPVAFLDHKNKGDRAKNCASGDDDGSYVAEEGVDRNNESGREKKDSPWHRVKWTDEMVKLLITAVSYIGEDASFDCNGNARRRSSLLPKKGKWKCISKVMAERGCLVSPQQCEDKFNDLNKRYKRLNEILGRGTSCKVVEDPTLLDLMDLPDKAKETVRKILSSKQLFYEEMCSYHNGNRLYLPHDRALQRSLLLALRSKDDDDPHESRPHRVDALDEEDHVMEFDDQDDETEEDHASHKGNGRTFVFPVVSAKRKKKQGEEHEIVGLSNTLNFLDCNKRSDHHPSNDRTHVNHIFTEGREAEWIQNQSMVTRSLQLEEQKLQIQAEMLELEKQRFKWLRFSQQEDRELEKMRLKNKCMKLENERLALEINRRELRADYN